MKMSYLATTTEQKRVVQLMALRMVEALAKCPGCNQMYALQAALHVVVDLMKQFPPEVRQVAIDELTRGLLASMPKPDDDKKVN